MAKKTLIESKLIAYLGALAIVLLGVSVAYSINENLKRHYSAEKRQSLTETMSDVAAVIQNHFSFHKYFSVSLSLAADIEGDMTPEEFSTLIERYSFENPGVINIALEKDWRVVNVHPFEPNKFVLGLDYRSKDHYRAAINALRTTGKPTLTGPVDLVQGGEGMIYRSPIQFSDDPSAEGAVAIVTDINDLIATVGARVGTNLVELEIGEGQNTRYYGAAISAADDPMSMTLEIGGLPMTVRVLPPQGWAIPASSQYAVFLAVAMTVLSLLSMLYWMRKLFLARGRSWRQLFDAIEAIDDGIALYSPDDEFILCNSRYKSYFKRSAHLLKRGNKFEDILWAGVILGEYPEAIGCEKEWYHQRLKEHRMANSSSELKLQDDRWLKSSDNKLSDGSSVKFRVDISKQKLAQLEAEEANTAKSNFLNVMSHEIRTPLSAISGYSRILKSGKRLPAVKACIEKAQDVDGALADDIESVVAMFADYAERADVNCQHLLSIVNDILYWNEVGGVERPLEKAEVNLNDILISASTQLNGLAAEKGLGFNVATTDITVEGGPVRLKQVVLNLVGNAIKFTAEGEVSVDVKETHDAVVLEVQDTGPGIPEAAKDRIFDSFYQVDSGLSRQHEGSGLGLAISRDIVEKHGGQMSVETELGKGSVFRVTLPKKAATASTDNMLVPFAAPQRSFHKTTQFDHAAVIRHCKEFAEHEYAKQASNGR